jgi:spermidine synthase
VTPDDPDPPRRPLLPLLGLFFLSGAVGLLYEVLWMRRLTLVFGATQLAIATVLGAFMLGLAGGGAIGGRLADRGRGLLAAYGVLELVVGGYALLFPVLLRVASGYYATSFGVDSVDWWGGQLRRLVLMGALLVVPTAAMGATLPLLARHAADRASAAARRTGLLYGANTAGAVVGTWATGFVLLPALGVRSTEVLAAVANLAVGAFALLWAARQGHDSPMQDDRSFAAEREELLDLAPDPDRAPARRRLVRSAVVAALAVSGACAMLYEVAWSRFLALVLGSSVYAFTLMLVAFLVGTAAGALTASGRVGQPGHRPLRELSGALALAGLAAFGTNHLFRFMPYWYVDLYAIFDGEDSFVFVAQAMLAGLVMTPTTFCIGLAFPLAVAAVVDQPGSVGRSIGALYVGNTLGAVVGAVGAGFLLIPWLGIQDTLRLAVLLDLGLAVLILSVRALPRRRRVAGAGGLAALALAVSLVRPPWDPLLMSAGMYKYVSDLADYSHEAVRNYALSDFELLYYAEGITSVVTVARSLGSGNIWLANNGKVDASTDSDMRTQVLLGHLPFLYKPGARSALVVGLASGITAGSALLEEGLESLDILEIEPAVVQASHYFDLHNGRPLDDPRTTMITNDARNHLVLTDRTYDVIINEPSNPWISGVSNLFTAEYLRLGRSRLAPDGVFVQWTQVYGMGREDLKSLLATFADVFPNVVVFSALEDTDLILLGSRRPLLPFPSDLAARGWDGPRGADLARVGVEDPHDLLGYVLMDRDGVVAVAGDAPQNTDDNALIEFHAPKYLHYATSKRNIELLMDGASYAWPLYRDQLRGAPDRALPFLLGLGGAYEKRGLEQQAAACYLEASHLLPHDPRVQERLARVRAWVER